MALLGQCRSLCRILRRSRRSLAPHRSARLSLLRTDAPLRGAAAVAAAAAPLGRPRLSAAHCNRAG
eukprot:scaffold83928_cov55-Phaeocystis_antarctica.AAC.6